MRHDFLTTAWSKLRYHPTQSQLWQCRKRFKAVAAGRGSGKTEIAKRHLVRALYETINVTAWDDPRLFYAAPTEQQAKRIAWQHLQKLTPKHWVANINNSELMIETIWGAQLWVVGMDKPQRYEGVQWDGGVLDEACDHKPKTFDLTILPMLTHRNGWCWRIGVPKRTGPSAIEFREFFEAGKEGSDTIGSYWWESGDILTPEQLAYAAEHMDPADFNEQFRAIFQNAGGGVFYTFDRQLNVRPCRYDHTLPLIVGQDFNIDPMCWAIGHRRGDTLEWFDEIYAKNCNTEMALDMLFERYKNHEGGVKFFPDASGAARKTSAAMTDIAHIINHPGFKELGATVIATRKNPPVKDRFAVTNSRIKNANGDRNMFFDKEGCPNLIKDMESRYYLPGTMEVADKKVYGMGHMSDAIGYVCYRMFPMTFGTEGRESISNHAA